MSKENEINKEGLTEGSPLHNSNLRNNPFIVPDGYFDTLPMQILEKCKQSDKPIPALIPHKIAWLFRPQWMIATFIFVAGICFFIRQKNTNNANNYRTLMATIPDSIIMQHLQNNIDNIDIDTLESMAQVAEITNNTGQPVLLHDSTADTIINYLINNNVNETDIENEL